MASSMDIESMSPKEKTTYTWTVDNVRSFIGDRSDDFLSYKGLTVDLVLYPTEKEYYLPKHYSLYLGLRTDCDREFKVYSQISLLNDRGEKCHTKEGFVTIVNRVIESNWQYTFSCAFLESKGLLVDDQLQIYCEVHVLPENQNASTTKPVPREIIEGKHSTIMDDLVKLFESKKYSDVILVASEKQFPAHKSILASRSPVFAAMFEHECEETKHNRVEVTDVDAETLSELLRYIYTDKCSSLDHYSADLMIAADKYQMDSLKANCEHFLSTNLTVDTAVKLFLLSDMHSADRLKANCIHYITAHCTELSFEQWKTLIHSFKLLKFN